MRFSQVQSPIVAERGLATATAASAPVLKRAASSSSSPSAASDSEPQQPTSELEPELNSDDFLAADGLPDVVDPYSLSMNMSRRRWHVSRSRTRRQAVADVTTRPSSRSVALSKARADIVLNATIESTLSDRMSARATAVHRRQRQSYVVQQLKILIGS